MTDDEYRAGLDVVGACVRMLSLVPFAEMLSDCEKVQTLAPMLDPTTYMRGGRENLDDQLEILVAAAQLMAAADRIKSRRVLS